MTQHKVYPTWLAGLGWYLSSILFSNLNDVIGKYLGQGLPPVQVTFLRFFLSACVLLPWIIKQYPSSLPQRQAWGLHLVRGSLLALAMGLWIVGLTAVPMTLATVISFAIPLFTLPLAALFLKESVGKAHWIATLGGFAGVCLAIKPQGHWHIHPAVLGMLLSACLFSIQDIINKRYVHRQSLLEMVFYLAVVAAALLAWGAVRVWVAPQAAQWGLLLGLACGSNLILVCLLRAFKLAEASFYAPFRYTEILASSALGWVVFGEVPSRYTLLGAGIVMLCALYITGVKARAAAAPTTDTEAPAPWPATKLAPSSPRPSGQKK